MERDPDFHALGSAMGWTYAELADQPFEVGHYDLYVPRHRGTGPLPAIVFLHGFAGNFKVYTWVWAKLAEARGVAIIAPSDGAGYWRPPGGIDAVFGALDDASAQVAIDPERVYLAGLSNGGYAAWRAAQAAPERFRGLILISPVMDARVMEDAMFLRRWGGRPVLVVTGEADERIPLSYVHEHVTTLQANGVPVQEVVYPGEDHFLLFSKAQSVMDDIARWLADAGVP
jgi:pimeloyl-ACP methyl ester carboxylesterase